MQFDWQNVTVALLILAALVYLGRRGWARLRSMRPGARAADCATGCGGCGQEGRAVTAAAPVGGLVQLSRGRAGSRPAGTLK